MTTPSIPARFEVLAEVASSEAEILLRARDTVLEREVFLKCPGPGLATAYRDRDLAETVLREARALARVRHPAVVGLIDVHETADGPMLVLEPITGETLAERLEREGRLEPAEVVELGIALAGALGAVHAAGVLHRGIGAESIVLGSDGRASLTGFHFAKAHAGGGLVSMASIDYETPGRCPALPEHPAPEQIQGQRADARCDLFSLAWVLFESLTGEAPFEGSNPFEWKKPKDAGKLVDEAPRELVRALGACLAPDASRRLDGAAALRRALEACRPTEAAGATAPTPEKGSRRRLAYVTAAAVVALAGLTYIALDRFGGESDSVEASPRSGRGLDVVEDAGPGEYSREFSSRHALLIGIGNAYEGSDWSPLSNTVKDVLDVGARLDDLGWDVETLTEEKATRAEIENALHVLKEVEEDGQILVWYAGHGGGPKETELAGWIVPADCENPDDVNNLVAFSYLEDTLLALKAKHALLVVDCCEAARLNPMKLVAAQATRGSREVFFQENFVTKKRRDCLVSSRANENAKDGVPGENSPFARAFLNALAVPQTAVLSSEINTSIRREFFEADDPDFQQPTLYGRGEFVIFLQD